MFKNWVNKKSIIAVMAIAMLVLAGCSNDGKKANDDVVATVGGENITKDDLYDLLVTNAGEQALEALIDEKIVESEIKKEKISISQDEIDQEMDLFVEEAGGEEAFNALLTQRDISTEDFEKDIKQYLSIRKLMEPLIEVTDEEIKAYFEENKAELDVEEEVDVRHILVKEEDLAKELVQKIKDGEDFAELAKEHSTDAGSAAIGGNIGFFPRGKMVPEFEEKAFSMNIGDISEPVKSSHGYHIIEVLDKQEAKEATFEDHKEEIKEQLIEMKMQTEYVTWLTEKREEYDIDNKLFGSEEETDSEEVQTEE